MEKFKVGDRVRLKGRNIEGVVLYNADISTILTKFIGDGYSEYCLYSPEELEFIARDRPKADTRVIINPPAVILFRDDKKYVAKAQDEPFNPERGLMVALLKSFGIGYSDIQEMLKGAKYQTKLSKLKNGGLPQKGELYAFTNTVPDNLTINEHCEFSDEDIIRAIEKGVESAKPKPKRGRPRKFRVGDKVVIKNDIYNKLYEITEKIEFDTSINLHLRDVRTDEERWANSRNVELVERANDKGGAKKDENATK